MKCLNLLVWFVTAAVMTKAETVVGKFLYSDGINTDYTVTSLTMANGKFYYVDKSGQHYYPYNPYIYEAFSRTPVVDVYDTGIYFEALAWDSVHKKMLVKVRNDYQKPLPSTTTSALDLVAIDFVAPRGYMKHDCTDDTVWTYDPAKNNNQTVMDQYTSTGTFLRSVTLTGPAGIPLTPASVPSANFDTVKMTDFYPGKDNIIVSFYRGLVATFNKKTGAYVSTLANFTYRPCDVYPACYSTTNTIAPGYDIYDYRYNQGIACSETDHLLYVQRLTQKEYRYSASPYENYLTTVSLPSGTCSCTSLGAIGTNPAQTAAAATAAKASSVAKPAVTAKAASAAKAEGAAKAALSSLPGTSAKAAAQASAAVASKAALGATTTRPATTANVAKPATTASVAVSTNASQPALGAVGATAAQTAAASKPSATALVSKEEQSALASKPATTAGAARPATTALVAGSAKAATAAKAAPAATTGGLRATATSGALPAPPANATSGMGPVVVLNYGT
jgi:hypothetical protein